MADTAPANNDMASEIDADWQSAIARIAGEAGPLDARTLSLMKEAFWYGVNAGSDAVLHEMERRSR